MKLSTLALAAALGLIAAPALAEEQPVDPYTVSDANAGTAPITDPAVVKQFEVLALYEPPKPPFPVVLSALAAFPAPR